MVDSDECLHIKSISAEEASVKGNNIWNIQKVTMKSKMVMEKRIGSNFKDWI